MSKSSKLFADSGHTVSGESSTQPSKRSESPKGRNCDKLRAVVLEAIGEPDDLFRVDLKTLHTPRHYRVNVYREIKNCVHMTDSYYIIATEDVIVSSNPCLKKKYHDADLKALTKSS